MEYKRHEFCLYKGFDSVEEAQNFIDKFGFSTHEGFVYIRVKNDKVDYIYPVTMENLSLQIILTKELCWFRDRRVYGRHINNYDLYDGVVFEKDSTTKTGRNALNDLHRIAKKFDSINPRISRVWNTEYKEKLEENYDVEIAYKGANCARVYYIEDDCIILLSAFFFGIIGEE